MENENFDGKLSLRSDAGWPVISSLLTNPCKILILTHKNPDGDAVGSALGLSWVLQNIGHSVTVAIPDDSPGFLKWLPGHDAISVHDRKSGKNMSSHFDNSDLVICADFNTPERLGSIEPLYRAYTGTTLLIDHHPKGEPFTKYHLIDYSKGSTSELIFLMLVKLGLADRVGPESATCLLAGIMTDTVGLRVSSSYPEVFETVASLMRLGAEKDRIYNEIYNMFSADRMKLLGYSLDHNMKILPEYRAAYIALTNNELKIYNHKKGDTEGFVNYPLSISGVVFSVLFTEQKDHIKLSLRSRGTFPANQFAQKYFLGGGHLNASGGRFFGTMEGAVSLFESVLEEYRELLWADKQITVR